MKKENLVSINTPPVGTPPGDFASGERTEPLTAAEEVPGNFSDTDV